ncbi:hypothetical protein HAX54_046163 [Datura stramonium]|uniref:Uncharacterized protein n=1 Tax=Datura stramonium TaxID=4076 RepID=A0ABS8WIT8_DATST|nr:hypothetical protein [Datura stramonium]
MTSIWMTNLRKIRIQSPRTRASSGKNRKGQNVIDKGEGGKGGHGESSFVKKKFGGCYTSGGQHLKRDSPVQAKACAARIKSTMARKQSYRKGKVVGAKNGCEMAYLGCESGQPDAHTKHMRSRQVLASLGCKVKGWHICYK